MTVVVQHELRESDLLVRYGGEEFVVILTGTGLIMAEIRCRWRIDFLICVVCAIFSLGNSFMSGNDKVSGTIF
jgi:GGDEF domain-containing protein